MLMRSTNAISSTEQGQVSCCIDGGGRVGVSAGVIMV
jgi:hypothetical protein